MFERSNLNTLMLDFLAASFFGWPVILIAAILAVIGLLGEIIAFWLLQQFLHFHHHGF